MLRLRILSVGKTKELWLEHGIEEYLKRLQNIASIDFIWAKNDEQLVTLALKESALICMDIGGKMMDSEAFSVFLHQHLQEGGSRLSFVIGGAEGLPPQLKKGYPLISLSPMTFTHQLARLILVEQIYRAFEIAKGSRYHK